MSDTDQHALLRDPERLLTEVQRLGWALGLPENTLRDIVAAAEYVEFSTGGRAIELDAESTHVYFLVRGAMRVVLYDSLGKQVSRHSITRGDVIGLFSAVLADRSTLDAEATEPTAAIRFKLPTLLKLTSKHPAFNLAMLRLAASMARQVIVVDRARPKPAVVAIVHHTEASRPLASLLAKRLVELGEQLCVAGDEDRWKPAGNVPFRSLVERGEVVDAAERHRILRECASYGRLLVDVNAGLGPDRIAEVISFSDVVLWCVRDQDAALAVDALRALAARAPAWREKVRLVWILAGTATAAPDMPELLQRPAHDFKLTFDPPNEKSGALLSNGVERIVHHLRGVRIGLALGGGAARGMAHLGVLKALEDNGIVVDMIAGTSAGAMTGTVYAGGVGPQYGTECFKRDLLPSWFLRQLPAAGYWYLLYKYRLHRFEPMLRKYLGHVRMEQLLLPMATISVDLIEGISLVRDSGDATVNILESINLPPLSLPLISQGQALVDGGLLNNVPANVLLEKGCNFVIASTVTAKIEKDFMAIRARKRSRLTSMFSTVQVVMRQNMIQSHNMNSVGIQPADFVIAPDVTAFDLSEFTRADELAAIGESTTRESISALRSMLAKLDPNLFVVNASHTPFAPR